MGKNPFLNMIPLITFTSFVPFSIGIQIAATVLYFFSTGNKTTIFSLLLFSLSFFIIGILLVTAHLGHKMKAVFALRGIGHSFLSLEGFFSLSFCSFLVISIIIFQRNSTHGSLYILLIACSLTGLITVIIIGKVYDLPSQITWSGPNPIFHLLVMVMLVSTVTFMVHDSYPTRQIVTKTLSFIFIIATLFFPLLAIRKFRSIENKQWVFSFPRIKTKIVPLYQAEVLLILIAIVFLGLQKFYFVLLVVEVMLIIHRIAFYASSASLTPEAAIAIVKAERMKEALGCIVRRIEQ